ncbi:MAG: (2Fe-2S)-binding protein [Pseudonocardia sp.]|nr:(2Fe-2S)-binding protein [Pseudonocardia sp.]
MTDDASAEPDVRAALDDVTGIGEFFAATANPAEVVDDSWRPLRELYTDPGPLADRIRRVRDALGTSDDRVAASIAYQGLAARLASPVVAVAAVHGVLPTWSPDTLHWRPSVVGPWPLWESAERAVRPVAAELASSVADALLEPHLAALADATTAVVSVSGRTLRGNAASALVGAGRMVAGARPGSAGSARHLVAGLLTVPWLDGAGAFGPGWSFRRRSCCLYYRVPGGGLCGDCVLASRAGGAG